MTGEQIFAGVGIRPGVYTAAVQRQQTMRQKIIDALAQASRQTDDGDPMAKTIWAVAAMTSLKPADVEREMFDMMSEGLVYRPIETDLRFFSLTEAGMMHARTAQPVL